jgi:hypothetical protein
VKPKTILALLWAGFSLLLLYWAVRLWGHFPAFMDTMEYVFPEKWFNVESFHQGRIPLWNPSIACGTPHLAAFQPAPFYPLFWLWNWTGLSNWFFMMALFHEALAAAGFYFWGRALKASPLVATFCALGFAGSALMTFYWGFPTHLASVAWIPWVFFASARYKEKPAWAWWGLVSLFWTLQILAGYPIFTFYAGLFWTAWLCVKARGEWRIPLGMGGAFLGAMAVSAAQWLPFADFLGSLHREGWGDYLYDLHWTNYLTLFQPNLLGIPGTGGYKGDYPDFIFNNLYLGLVPLILFAGLFFSAKSRDFFWKGSSLFWFIWLPGIHFFLWKILPNHWMDRLEPAKAAFLFVFCAFTALAVGITEWSQSSHRKNKTWDGSTRFIRLPRGWAWVLGGLWALDILFVPSRVIQTVSDPFQDGEVRQSASRAGQLTGEGRMVSLRTEGKIYPTTGGTISDSIRETAMELVPNTNAVWGLRSARGYLTIYTDGFQNLGRYLQRGYPYDGRVLDAAGVRLLIGSEDLPAFKYKLSEVHGRTRWTQNAGAMGNAWKVDFVKEFPDRAAVFEALLDPKAFLENEVYTEKSPEGKAVCLPPSGRVLAGSGSTVFEKWKTSLGELLERHTTIENSRPSACQAQFEVETGNRGFLVFDESFAPGWHAWVEGIPKPIFRAYGLWMAVPLSEAGKQKVLFRYEPVSFRLGLFLSLVFLVSGLGSLVSLLKKHRIFQGL